jgi:hypothetical protein
VIKPKEEKPVVGKSGEVHSAPPVMPVESNKKPVI